MLEIGSLVDGKYKILNKIGQGGMSVVYLAMNERANKQWAVKEVRKDGVSNFEVVKQGLIAEVDLLKKLNHPHLPSIIDVLDADDSFLIVMDYIEGVSLNHEIKERGTISQDEVIEWGKQLCDVLAYLHSREKPIIYRDMKPSNVMLKPDGNVVLIDFGTAREFKSDSVADTTCLGTQGYAAPEQFGGQGQTDARTDIYCLGATLYHLVTGHNPCDYPYEMYPIRKWNPMLSSGLERIILKCTQKNPNDRYQSCAELMYALEHYKDLDVENQKKNNSRWNSFLSVAIASVVMFCCAGICKYVSVRDAEYDFSKYVNNASGYENFVELKSAAEIYPKRVEPYLKAIEIIKMDNVFTEAESTAITSCLIGPSLKPLEILQSQEDNKDTYYKFCYDMGIAYMFYYQSDNVGLAKAQKWLKLSAEALPSKADNGLGQNDIDNAKVLQTLSNALCEKNKVTGTTQVQVGGENQATGEVEYGYREYFEDLVSVIDFDFFSNSNSVTTRKVYSWIYSSLLSDYDKLKRDGVTNSRMIAVKERAISDLKQTLNSVTDTQSQSYSEISQLIENFNSLGSSWN